jgi:hypothetical protein
MRRAAYFTIGLISMLFGMIIYLWVAYNVFIQEQEAFPKDFSIIKLLLIGVPFLGVGFGMIKKAKKRKID